MQDEPKKDGGMTRQQIAGAVEAILFVAGDPVDASVLTAALEITRLELEAALEALEEDLHKDARGIQLMRYGDRLQLCTRPVYADYVERALNPTQRQSLTGTLLETLSVIAYKQPVTKADVEQVRGVKCDYSVAALTRLGLIEEVGRRETLGRPILYGTTEDFLRHFGISSLDELPALNLQQPSEPFDEPL
jgi:segregation and condensation protein B